jgi:hypothetical protein
VARVLRRHKLAGILVLAVVAALAGAVAIGRGRASPVVATVPLGQAQMAWPPVLDTRTGRVLIWPLNVGPVRVLDVSTGTLLKTVAIDSAPMAMDVHGDGFLVNEQQDRVFAVGRPTTGSTPFVGA